MAWEIIVNSVNTFNSVVIGYYILVNGLYTFLLLISLSAAVNHLHKVRYRVPARSLAARSVPPISILMPAYNEVATIVEAIRSLLDLSYPDYEIVVINDGSTDQTLKTLVEEFGLTPVERIYRRILPSIGPVRYFYINPQFSRLIVVDKEHSGKADSLNVGINIARNPYFCSVDADTLLEKDALLRLVGPILEDPDRIVACGGIVRIANGCMIEKGQVIKVDLPKEASVNFQVVEYLRSFLFGRAGWSSLNSLLVISGTLSMFHKKTIQKVGGYNNRTVTEDMELVVRLHRVLKEHRQRYRIVFINDPIAWTVAPRNLRMLSRQRQRWHKGLAGSLFAHWRMFLNPHYHQIGLLAMPAYAVIELLGPVVELAGYFTVGLAYFMGILDFRFFMLFLLLAILYGVFLSVGSVLLSEITYRRYPSLSNLFQLVIYGILENFGYRQLNAWWKLKGIWQFFLNNHKKTWEHLEKFGFETIKQH